MKCLPLFLLLFILATAGVEASCAAVSIEEEIKRSSAIFLGRVLAVAPATISSADGSRQGPGFRVRFSVEKSWKGQTGGRTSVFNSGSDPYPFRKGKRYLVFASKAYGSGPWITGQCRFTRDLNVPGDTTTPFLMAALGPGVTHSPPEGMFHSQTFKRMYWGLCVALIWGTSLYYVRYRKKKKRQVT